MSSQAHQAIVEQLRAQGPLGGHHAEKDVGTMRAELDTMAAAFSLPEGAVREPVDAGGVPAEWLETPGIDRGRVLLFFHGGGYVMGSTTTHGPMAAQIGAAAGMRVLIIDYRLAPEHPFPAALEDATAAYRFLLSEGYASDQIAVGGDSAGGGLTFACLLALREAGDPLPEAAIVLSPWVDLEGVGESMVSKAEADPMLSRDNLLRMAAHYLADQSARNPFTSPIHADLAGLPPLYIQAGTAEVLLDDSTRVADRARSAGVPVEIDLFEDLVHDFQSFAPLVPEAVEAIEKLGAFLRRQL